jgi:hypothetical protein
MTMPRLFLGGESDTDSDTEWRDEETLIILTRQVVKLKWTFISGVSSSRDPSNDLYGAKALALETKVGQAVPQEPTVSAISVEFLAENKCRCTSTTSF